MKAKRPSLSTQRIVTLLVFLVAALIASVMVYHWRNQEAPLVLADNNGTFFKAPRALKPFELSDTQGAAFTKKQLHGHWTLMVFGFTHCDSVCPITLHALKNAYPALKEQFPNLQIVFVSLDPERDTRALLEEFTKGFHPDFHGVSGSIQALRPLQGQLGIYASRLNESAQDSGKKSNFVLDHSSSIIVLNPKAEWAGIVRYGLTTAELTSTIQKGLVSLGEH